MKVEKKTLKAITFGLMLVALQNCAFTKRQLGKSISGERTTRAGLAGALVADVVTAPVQLVGHIAKRAANPKNNE